MRPPRSATLLCALLLLPAAARAQSDSTRSVPIAPLTRVPDNAWGANVIVIDSAEIAQSTASTFSELLQARRPGVRVFRSGGMASDGALVMLRGPTSFIGPSAPIVIVDGVRVDSRQSDVMLGGVSQPSRLDDILPEDIQRIEILSGTAAALYGDGAANGVILVTTKSGGRGPLRLTGRATWDASQTHDDFPANYQRIGVSPSTGQPVSDCSLIAVEKGQCTPTGLDVWNPLEQASPFHVGNSIRGHLELGGTSLGTPLSLGLTGDGRQGTMPFDDDNRLGARGKIRRDLPWGFGVEASGSYLRGNARLGFSPVINGLLGGAQDDANRGYFAMASDSMIPDAHLRHATGGARLTWKPLHWLEAAVMTGRDRVTDHGRIDSFKPPPPSPVADYRIYEEHDLTTSSAHASASYWLRYNITATTGAGYDRDVLRTRTGDSALFNGQVAGLTLTTFRLRSTAFWIDQQVMLSNQLAVGAAAERITSSMFGGNAGKEWFPSANLSWTPPLRAYGISNLRLGAAYAEAANPTQSLTTIGGIVVPSFQAPPPPPKLERTKNLELGADATLGGRISVSLTAFDSRSTHLWVSAFSQGVITPAQAAEMTNKGIETLITAPLLDISSFRWRGSLSLAVLHNEVTRLDAPPQFPISGSVVQGRPYGGVWGTTYTYADTNHDGIIGTDEVTLGSFSYLGPPLPTFESAFATELTLPAHLVLGGRLDYRSGYRVVNSTEALRCQYLICRASQDPSAPIDDQAAAAATQFNQRTIAAFAEDASFLRVREVSLRWPLPASLAGPLGTRAELTIAGRNLATWTRYPGLDPEISVNAPATLPRVDYFRLPLPRELIFRLDIGAR